jgi:hypothetical protein
MSDLRSRVAVRLDDEPAAAELGDVVAEDLPGLVVVLVVIERVPVIGDLPGSVLPLRRAEERGVGTGSSGWLALGPERRPCPRAVAVAAALVGLVAGEEVQREALSVEQHVAVL